MSPGADRQPYNGFCIESKGQFGQKSRKFPSIIIISKLPAMRLALYQPDIPQNTGTLLRLGACLGVPVDIIEPCGFVLSDRRMKRAGMDYLSRADWTRHESWAAFHGLARDRGWRIVLATTGADRPYTRFSFSTDDVLLLGRESAGVPDAVHDAADARITIPMVAGARSLNVAVAGAMIMGEALRQCGLWPDGRDGTG